MTVDTWHGEGRSTAEMAGGETQARVEGLVVGSWRPNGGWRGLQFVEWSESGVRWVLLVDKM